MKMLIAAIVGFLGFTFWSRIVQEKGLKLLSNEQRGALLDKFSATRKWSILFLAGIVLGFLLLAYYVEIDKEIAMYSYFAAFLVYSIVVTGVNLSKLKDMELPQDYYKSAWMASILD